MRTKWIAAACVAAGVVLLGPSSAIAQDANRDVVMTKSDMRDIVKRLARRTGEFKEDFDKAVEHSLMDGSKMEERAKHRADDLHDAAKKLEDVFGDKHDKMDPKVRNQADKTLAAAADVNRIMMENRFTDKLQRDWDILRSDCNALAAVYDLTPIQ